MNNANKINPRHVCFSVLNTYFQKKSGLKKIVDRYFNSAGMPDIDKRFAYEIIKGTIRFYLKIDYIISCFSERGINKIDFPVLNILRMAVYQFLYMDRVPPHAIVNESVGIARKYCSISSTGFVNAILRKISKIDNFNKYIDLKINENIKGVYENISIKYSFPVWMVKYFSAMYPHGIIEKICSSLNMEPSMFIRVNRLKTTKEKLVSSLLEKPMAKGRDFTSLNEPGSQNEIFSDTFILNNRQDIKDLEVYKKGYFYIQDFSSQAAIKYFLQPQKNEKILDLCGAPGGKATYISEITEDRCLVTSVDINIEKLEIFKENIKRLGIKNITVLGCDAQKLNIGYANNYFDKIFVDAPCSAFGTISKNPDAKYNREFKDLERLGQASHKILANCLSFLKSGGKIFFYTCTLSSVENQNMIRDFTAENKLRCKIVPLSEPSNISIYLDKKNAGPRICSEPFYEILPYYFGSEGGFIACIEKL